MKENYKRSDLVVKTSCPISKKKNRIVRRIEKSNCKYVTEIELCLLSKQDQSKVKIENSALFNTLASVTIF